MEAILEHKGCHIRSIHLIELRVFTTKQLQQQADNPFMPAISIKSIKIEVIQRQKQFEVYEVEVLKMLLEVEILV